MIVRRPATTPEVAADYSCPAGASPAWHPAEGRLYWIDAASGRLFRCTPSARTHELVYSAGAAVGAIAVQADATVLLLMASGAVKVWREDSVVTMIEPGEGERAAQVVCAAADPAGRVVLGLAADGGRTGRISRLETDGKIVLLAEGAQAPAGFAFTPDGQGMYCAGLHRGTVSLFDYGQPGPSLGEARPFAVYPESLGAPAGLAVDSRGFVWAGARGGSCALRFSSDSREEQRLYFPAALVSGLALAGEDGRELWVTTAGGDDKKANGAGAGALYRFRTGVRGPSALLSRVTVPRD
jgi:D-xylono/L-arabinono-1,4-lactonase